MEEYEITKEQAANKFKTYREAIIDNVYKQNFDKKEMDVSKITEDKR